jgi:tetratricopeptide (TPR) repeat protein
MRKSFLLVLILAAAFPVGSALAQAGGGSDLLNEAVEEYNANNLSRAALLFYEVKMTDTQAANRAQAEYYLAQSLFKLGMYQSALAYYNAVFVAGPAHPY